MQHKLLQSYVIKRSQPKKAAYEVKPLAMQCNFNQGGTPLWLCFYNVMQPYFSAGLIALNNIKSTKL